MFDKPKIHVKGSAPWVEFEFDLYHNVNLLVGDTGSGKQPAFENITAFIDKI